MELILVGVALTVFGYFVYSRVQIGREERKNRLSKGPGKEKPPTSER